MVGRISSAALGILVTLLLARVLSPGNLGTYFVASSVASFLGVLSSFGLPVTAMRKLSEAEADAESPKFKELAGSILVIGTIAAMVPVGLFALGLGELVATTFFRSLSLEILTLPIAIWALSIAVQNLIAEICRGFQRIDLALLSQGLISGVILAGALLLSLLAAFSLSLTTVVALSILSVAISFTCGAPVLRLPNPEKLRCHGNDVRRMATTALPIWLHSLVTFALLNAGIWIIAATVVEEQVAIYGAASRLATIFTVANGVFYAVLPPIIVRLSARGDKQTLQRLISGSAALGAIITLPILLACLVVPSALLRTAFGEHFSSGSGVLIALSIGNYLNLATGIRGYALLICGYERIQLAITTFGGILNLLFVFLGVQTAGITGAGIGACFALVAQCVMEMVAVRRLLGIFTFAWVRSGDLRFFLQQKG